MINGMTLNQLAAECHTNNAKWWHDLETGEYLDRNDGELLMLVISEVAEAMEGERKGLMDDKLPHRPMAEVELVDAIIRLGDYAGGKGYDLNRYVFSSHASALPENKGEALLLITKSVNDIHTMVSGGIHHDLISEQIVWTLDLVRRYAARWGYDLDGAYTEKTAFNKVRMDHSAEGRKAAGGKKW